MKPCAKRPRNAGRASLLRYAESALLQPRRLIELLVALAALCSGAASLALEVVWSKALVVPLGNSSDATAAVLGGFMLGIAGGAYVGASWARHPTRSLRLYAMLELMLALFALVVPELLRHLAGISLPLAFATLPGAAFAARLAISLALITFPCLVMGATLPLLLATMDGSASRKRSIAVLYGINTFGATGSAVVSGFYGVAHWGIAGCSRRAALCSTAAAILALAVLVVRRRASGVAAADESAIELVDRSASDLANPAVAADPIRQRFDRRIALASTFVAGLALLAAEVFWARVLTFVFGHDTYAFSTLLGVVLLGLASGGLTYARFERSNPRWVAGWAMAAMALSLLGAFYLASGLLIRHGRDPFGIGDRFIGTSVLSVEMLREFAFTPILAFLPCFFSGLGYPAAIAWYAGTGSTPSRATGAVGLANGLGATLGASLTSLGLVSLLGIQGVLSSMALLAASFAALLLGAGRLAASRRSWASAPLLLALAMVAIAPRDLPRRMLLSVVGPKHQSLLFYEEGRTATVSVIRNSIQGERQLLVNAVNEVTTRLVHDQSFKLLGQLGPLLHPDPKRAVMICLGAGLAAGSALTHPLERLDVVDLLHSVRRGARLFGEENNHVLDDPRLALHVDDGRQYLLTTAERYDLAIVDSTHPKSVDSWILYTREFFQLLRSRLEPDGIVVQWLPLHGLSEREFIAVVATFARAFPQMTLWASVGYETYGQVGYAKLVGQVSDAPMRFDVARIQARLAYPRVQKDLARYGMGTLNEILDQFIAGPTRIRTWTNGSPILTDDRPFLAYLTPLAAGRPMTPDRLLAVRESVLPFLQESGSESPSEVAAARAATERSFEAQGMVIAGQLEQASRYHREGEKIRYYVEQTKTTSPYYASIASIYPNDPERLFEAGTQLGAMGHFEPAKSALAAGLRLNPDSLRLGLNAALLAMAAGDPAGAAQTLAALLARHPTSALLHYNLGVALLAQSELGAARRELTRATAIDPTAIGARQTLAETEFALGNPQQARHILEALVADEPRLDTAHLLLGRVQERLGDVTGATQRFERAARLNPYSETAAVEWGMRLVGSAPERAVNVLTRIEQLYPDSAAVRMALGEAYSRTDRWQEASLHFVAVLERDPRSHEAALGLGVALARLSRTGEAKDAFCLAHQLGALRPRVAAEMAALGEKFTGCSAESTAP